ncbi:hypothetical protein Lfu02_76130 [Longispora fulva]|nr:hypothetical protein Lfu02_76130 [Longispora fulva]
MSNSNRQHIRARILSLMGAHTKGDSHPLGPYGRAKRLMVRGLLTLVVGLAFTLIFTNPTINPSNSQPWTFLASLSSLVMIAGLAMVAIGGLRALFNLGGPRQP